MPTFGSPQKGTGYLVSLVSLLGEHVDQLGALHVVERVHIDSQSGGHRLDVQAKGGEQLEESHLLAGHGIGERGTRVIALRPTAAFQQTEATFLWHSRNAMSLLGLCARGGVVGGACLLGRTRFQENTRRRLFPLHFHLLLLRLPASLALLLPFLGCQLLAPSLFPLIIAIARLGAVVLLIAMLLPAIGLLLLLLAATLLPPLSLLLAQSFSLLSLLLAQVIVLALLPSRLGHIVMLLSLQPLTVSLVSLVIGMFWMRDRRRWFRGTLELVMTPTAR